MTSTIVSIKSTSVLPQRIVGAVSKDKSTGMVTVDYREPGKVKPSQKSFDPAELIAYQTGEGGFVVAMTTNPVAQMVGELVTKGDTQYLKTESGNVVLSKQPGVLIEFQPIDPESREARSVERASKVKVRGSRAAAKATTKESAKPSAKRSRRAAKEDAAPADEAKKKRRRAKA